MRAHLRLDDGKPGGPPRGLAHAGNALGLQPGEHLAYGGAGEAATLCLGKIIADGALDLTDRLAETCPIVFHQRRHEPHQREVRKMRSLSLRERLQRAECSALGLAEQAALRAVEHE